MPSDATLPTTTIRDFWPSDPAWPACLEALPDPPERLRVAGELPFLDRAVSIVGTRRATPDAIALTERLAHELAEAGCVIVSGGAEGIDAAAHRGALEAGGLGIAVLAGGIRRPYPARHAPLFDRIATHGAVISETEDHATPYPATFLARNRLIAALGALVVVIQAPIRSGALSTAARARALGRPTLVFPWALHDPHGEGTNLLLARHGARACLGAEDVLEALGDRPSRRLSRRAPRPRHSELEPDAAAVLEALAPTATYVDDLVRATSLPASRVQTILITLTLLGLALPDDRGAYRRAG